MAMNSSILLLAVAVIFLIHGNNCVVSGGGDKQGFVGILVLTLCEHNTKHLNQKFCTVLVGGFWLWWLSSIGRHHNRSHSRIVCVIPGRRCY